MIYSARPQPKTLLRTPMDKRTLTDKPSSIRIHRSLRMDIVEEPTPTGVLGKKDQEKPDLELAKRILSRIESRLTGRVRHLTVYTTENAVVLTGECSTFYTKQLAQHIAMGVLEYEQLINNIDVRTAK